MIAPARPVDFHLRKMQMVLMIICVCNRINCRSVREAMDAGAHSPLAVQAHYGCRFNCGKCADAISDMIAQRMRPQAADGPLLAAE